LLPFAAVIPFLDADFYRRDRSISDECVSDAAVSERLSYLRPLKEQ
jgi:hypothetical protein